MKYAEIRAVAGAAIAYGSPVKKGEGETLIPAVVELNWADNPVPGADDDLTDMIGVLKRPNMTSNFSHCAPGDEISVQTDGPIKADIQGRLAMLLLRDGKPTEQN